MQPDTRHDTASRPATPPIYQIWTATILLKIVHQLLNWIERLTGAPHLEPSNEDDTPIGWKDVADAYGTPATFTHPTDVTYIGDWGGTPIYTEASQPEGALRTIHFQSPKILDTLNLDDIAYHGWLDEYGDIYSHPAIQGRFALNPGLPHHPECDCIEQSPLTCHCQPAPIYTEASQPETFHPECDHTPQNRIDGCACHKRGQPVT